MKQQFEHYEKWEDYINGMYRTSWENESELVEKAKSVLCDSILFLSVMESILENWIIASKINLTNIGCNRRAWLGAAACCYKYGVPEILTRIAWNTMIESEQSEANKTAEKIILQYELKQRTHAQSEIRF